MWRWQIDFRTRNEMARRTNKCLLAKRVPGSVGLHLHKVNTVWAGGPLFISATRFYLQDKIPARWFWLFWQLKRSNLLSTPNKERPPRSYNSFPIKGYMGNCHASYTVLGKYSTSLSVSVLPWFSWWPQWRPWITWWFIMCGKSHTNIQHTITTSYL